MSSTESDTAFSTASDDHHSGKDDGSRKKIKVSSQPAKAREQSSKKRGRPQKVQDAQTPAEVSYSPRFLTLRTPAQSSIRDAGLRSV
jgi:hypothetical protein